MSPRKREYKNPEPAGRCNAFPGGSLWVCAVAVSPTQRDAVIRTFREKGSVHLAAVGAGVSDEEAEHVLRSEGFDLDSTDWFFESTAAFYRRAWTRSRRARRAAKALASGTFGRLPGADGLRDRVNEIAERMEAWVLAWSARYPAKKSVAALVLACFFLAAYWLVDPEAQGFVAGLFLAAFGVGSGLLYVHTRSPRLLGSSGAVGLATLAYAGTEDLAVGLGLSLTDVLVVEAARAILVAFLGWAFLDAIRQATGFLERLRIHLPFGSTVLTLGLFVGGTVAAIAELYVLSAFSGDPASVRFVARYGVSYLLWALGSASLLFVHLYLLYLAAITAMGRVTTERIVAAMITGVVLFAFLGTNYGTILATQVGGPPLPMRVGVHTNDVRAAFAGPWDPFVHLEVGWHDVELAPGVFNWSSYDAQLDRADRDGIEVYLLLGATPPSWFAELHADAAMRDASGRVFTWADEDPRVDRTRVWEFSFAAGEVVDAKLRFTRMAAARYANRPSVVAVSVQNEPSWPSDFDVFRFASYDAYTVDAFRADLASRYGTLDALNAEHRTSFTNWSEVEAPTLPGELLWPRWIAFREDHLADFVDRLVSTVRAVTTKPVTVKVLAHYLSRYVTVQTGLTERVLKRFVNASDIVSLDLYPLSRADLRRALVYFRGLAGDKPIWVTEFNFLLGFSFPGSGSATYAALVEMSRFADRAIVFTWEAHYLYGVRLYPSVPGVLGIEMFRDVRDGQVPFSPMGRLLPADLTAIPNLYGSYVLASLFADLPLVPWPVLLLFLVPVPIADPERKKRVRRGVRLAGLALFVVVLLVTNLAAMG